MITTKQATKVYIVGLSGSEGSSGRCSSHIQEVALACLLKEDETEVVS